MTAHETDPLEARLTKASNSIRAESWLPPQWGEVPRIRLGKRYINVLWAIPLGFVVLILGIAICQGLYETAWFQQFLTRYPGIAKSAPAVHSGFPPWLRVEHFLNMLFMFFIIRAGIQILADHPRLYWNRDCTPETDWFRFLHSVPRDRVWRSKDDGRGGVVKTLDVLVPTDEVWTSKSDSVNIPDWLGIPGIRHSVGPARWWHFSLNLLWVLNGVAFYAMLFATDQWLRLVPTNWAVFPNALTIVIQYWSLHFPVDHSWTNYNALQQLTYFITVFIAAPVQIATGLMQSPAIANKLGWLGRPFNRQTARTIHFFGLLWFVFFILVHGVFVFITAARPNLNAMWAGVNNNNSWEGVWIFAIAAAVLIASWLLASPFTIKFARLIQNIGKVMVGPLKGAAEMNGSALPLLHGAPLRLRCENELGFKMVKWIQSIEFVHDYAQLGSGQGGYNEDHEFYGNRMSI